MLKIIPAADIDKYLDRKDVIIIDLRDGNDYEKMHLRGAVNVPYDRLLRLNKSRYKQKTFLVYCDMGHLSLKACVKLDKKGYNVISVAGGFEGLKAYYGN